MNGHVGLKQTCNIYLTYIPLLSYGIVLSLFFVGGLESEQRTNERDQR